MIKLEENYSLHNVKSPSTPTIDLPWVYRVVNIEREHLAGDSINNIAELFHDQATICVSWQSYNIDETITVGVLVSPCWKDQWICTEGNVEVASISAIANPSGDINLFETVPYEWIKNRELVQKAKQIIASLPKHFALLFTAIFWDFKRFQRFINGPSSLNGHHNWKHGNFTHTVEVAENARDLAENRPCVCLGVLIIAALLHDAAKTDEYKFNHQRGCFEISSRGALIGHKMSIIEWIAASVARYQIPIPNQEYLGLMHILTAVKGAPQWIGLKEPASPECTLLSVADRLSGEADLLNQTMSSDKRFGKYHKHLRGRPFMINAASC